MITTSQIYLATLDTDWPGHTKCIHVFEKRHKKVELFDFATQTYRWRFQQIFQDVLAHINATQHLQKKRHHETP
jgi:hypothetical protein